MQFAMDVLNPCCCCLFRLPEKKLKTPYVHLGLTEIYSNMIEECFEIQLTLGSDDESGICSICLGRLRDARDFKLQVQRSQAELRARLEGASLLKVEDSLEDLELFDQVEVNEECIIYEELPLGTELFDEDDPSDDVFLPEVKVSPADPACAELAFARQQLAMSCSVRLERLRDDGAPHACPTCLKTFDHEAILATHMRVHDNHDDSREISDIHSNDASESNICGTCGKSFKTKSYLEQHLRAFQPFSCLTKIFKCHVCDMQFNTKWKLKIHNKRVHIPKYMCGACNKVFNVIENLSLHKKQHIREECDEQIKRIDAHTEAGHNKLNTCDICKVHFTSMYELFLHIRGHTGRKPFSCEICPERFSYNIDLMEHRQKKHTA